MRLLRNLCVKHVQTHTLRLYGNNNTNCNKNEPNLENSLRLLAFCDISFCMCLQNIRITTRNTAQCSGNQPRKNEHFNTQCFATRPFTRSRRHYRNVYRTACNAHKIRCVYRAISLVSGWVPTVFDSDCAFLEGLWSRRFLIGKR